MTDQFDNMSDEQLLAAARAVSDALGRRGGGEQVPDGNASNSLADEVNAKARDIQRLAGVDLNENDPEVEYLKRVASGAPEDYLEAVSKATKDKKTRQSLEAELGKRNRRIAELRKLPSYNAAAQKEITRLQLEINDLAKGR